MASANNPFDLNTTSGAQLAGSAASAITAPTVTGYNAATTGATGYNASTAGAQGYDAATYNASGYTGAQRTAQGYDAATYDAAQYEAAKRTAQGYDAAQGAATNWNVNNDQTVQGQVSGIIAANSPLVQQARAASLAQMNARGLTNSSMALGEGQKAVINTAVPIAQQDASTYANSAKFNADSANSMSQFNVGQKNTALGFTATANNQASADNQAAANRASEFNTGAKNTAAANNATAKNSAMQFTASANNAASADNQASANAAMKSNTDALNAAASANAASKNTAMGFTAKASNDASLANAASQNKASEFSANATNSAALTNATAQNDAAKFKATAANTASTQYATALNSTVQKMMDQSLEYATKNADNATKIELQTMVGQASKDVAALEATYKNQMQASQSAGDIFQQATKNIADVMANPDLSAFPTTDGKSPAADGSNLPPGASISNGVVVDANGAAIKSPKQAAVDAQQRNLKNSMDILSATSGVKLSDGTSLSKLLTF